MAEPITIIVQRQDGFVSRLEGTSGLAVCCASTTEPTEASSTPVTSFRCSNAAELAWNLAALMAGVRHLSPEAFDMAHRLMGFMNFAQPEARNVLPPERRANGGSDG